MDVKRCEWNMQGELQHAWSALTRIGRRTAGREFQTYKKVDVRNVEISFLLTYDIREEAESISDAFVVHFGFDNTT